MKFAPPWTRLLPALPASGALPAQAADCFHTTSERFDRNLACGSTATRSGCYGAGSIGPFGGESGDKFVPGAKGFAS